MKFKLLIPIAILSICISCKKDSGTQNDNIGSLQDGPQPLGKLLVLGKYGNQGNNVIWGRNSNELFLNTSAQAVRFDFNTGGIEELGTLACSGKTHENGAIILSGKKDNESGYFQYSFNTNKMSFIFAVAPNQTTFLNIAGNNYFYTVIPASNVPPVSCTGFCWPAPPDFGNPAPTYHRDLASGVITELKNKTFYIFSKDGSKTILNTTNQFYPLYIFDNTSKKIVDSLPFQYGVNLYYLDDVLKSLSVLGGDRDELTIKNAFTGEVIRSINSKISVSTDSPIKFSKDGTKLYYTGRHSNVDSTIIAMYDLGSGEEKILAGVSHVNTPIKDLVLSDDNKRMAIQHQDGLYIKELE